MDEDTLFKLVWPPGIERRNAEWREEVGRAIADVCGKLNKQPEELSKDDRFLDAISRATAAALKDHRRERWKLLHNGLVNSALPPPLDEDLQQVFFQFLDELTLAHIAMLKAIDSPYDPEVAGISTVEFVKRRLGKTATDEPMLRGFLDQLEARRLLRSSSPRTPVGAGPFGQTSFTEMGKQFLAFVSTPDERPVVG
jgi:hypothetical protein